MISKIKRYVFIAIASLTMLAPGLVPSFVGVASANSITDNLCTGADTAVTGGGSGTCTTTTSATLSALAVKIINAFSVIIGLVAVIMIIFGGFKYITSGGDSNSVSGAKNTLIYAIIGLIIVALAQFIVHFVLSTTANTVVG